MPFIYFIDRKSTRLNSSHLVISYAVFCLKKKTLDTSMPGAVGFIHACSPDTDTRQIHARGSAVHHTLQPRPAKWHARDGDAVFFLFRGGPRRSHPFPAAAPPR